MPEPRRESPELIMFLPARQRGEVPPSYGGGGVMSLADAVAHDPSVADYRATSPASPGR
jgi:hypothetical protein